MIAHTFEVFCSHLSWCAHTSKTWSLYGNLESPIYKCVLSLVKIKVRAESVTLNSGFEETVLKSIKAMTSVVHLPPSGGGRGLCQNDIFQPK